MVLLPGSGDSFEHFREPRLAPAIFRRKISAADERLQVGREPHAHRPAAAAGRRLNESHVNAVDVRPFFAIDLDVHELAIHDRGDLRVLERFVRHDVAPVAGRIADGEKDRLILPARFCKSFFAPREPIHRVVRMLEKVRRLLAREPVVHRSPYCLVFYFLLSTFYFVR